MTETDPTRLAARAERQAAGRALREKVSRESHATSFKVDTARDPLPVLTAGDQGRIKSLLPLRYSRMAENPFCFYRGAAALMAHDLAPLDKIGLPVQASGDCHLMNFGCFASAAGDVLFDINDFDETYPGVDFVVDLKRLTASVAVAAAAAGAADAKAESLAKATARAYREFMGELADMSPLDVWRVHVNLKDELAKLEDTHEIALLDKTLRKAEKKGKHAHETPGVAADELRFEDEDGKVFHTFPDGTQVRRVLSGDAERIYRATLPAEQAALIGKYTLHDVAFKIVGVGSVGTYCAIGLWASGDGETMVLQLKEASPSVIAGFAPGALKASHQGKRVVDGQRAMQAAPDPFLGWTQDDAGRHFYLRQLKNRRLGSIGDTLEAKALPAYATLCARTLARAHARTGDPAAIFGYMGGSEVMDEALAGFAKAYLRQTKADHARLAASSLAKAD